MRGELSGWVSNANAMVLLEAFGAPQTSISLDNVRNRLDDYYVDLVGQLFTYLRTPPENSNDWGILGNAFAQLALDRRGRPLSSAGISIFEALLFSAIAFYAGGNPASACLVARRAHSADPLDQTTLAVFELLARTGIYRSEIVNNLLSAFRRGDLDSIATVQAQLEESSNAAIIAGPDSWIPARLLEVLVHHFARTNLRAVLPDGRSDRWTPLVEAFLLDTQKPVFEFFPSQIAAFSRGVLDVGKSFSLQMPTGSGKTALCETILFHHATAHPGSSSLLLVPFRSLAAELKGSVAPRLKAMGVTTRSVYGGTVPTRDEVQSLEDTQVLITTPESLSGVLSASPGFLNRVELVICDEGHLLDGGARGVGLELLIARLLAREIGQPRFIFVSAIVPNIEEVNAWLGGTTETVVRSLYRPALADFAVLSEEEPESTHSFALAMNLHRNDASSYEIEGFLRRQDFRYFYSPTKRYRTYGYSSVKTRAVAAARKALPTGTTALFASNKRGLQGAIGLATELVDQLGFDLPLPSPLDYCDQIEVGRAVEYLRAEYGDQWIGAKALEVGVVLHHGDIPQETREVLEPLLRKGHVRLTICTSTLAEGVNLPIRTLVLYSVERRSSTGTTPLLARDIKNLVGRAGRAGSSTSGLVIVANEDQWPRVAGVAADTLGEPVYGALGKLLTRLQQDLAFAGIELDDSVLERDPDFHPIIDGVDACLIDLITEEIGDEKLVEMAVAVAACTFAYTRADSSQKALLNRVFVTRATHLGGLRRSGRIGWLRESGVRARLVSSVESGLLPSLPDWTVISDPADPRLFEALIGWSLAQPEVRAALREHFRLGPTADLAPTEAIYMEIVRNWLGGLRFGQIVAATDVPIDDLLWIHAGVTTFALQTSIEQGITILGRLLGEQAIELPDAVIAFPAHLRFGTYHPAAVHLLQGGLRHRAAAIVLSSFAQVGETAMENVFVAANRVLLSYRADLVARLGALVVDRIENDLARNPA